MTALKVRHQSIFLEKCPLNVVFVPGLPVTSFDEEPVGGRAGAQPWAEEDDLIEDDLGDSDEEDPFKNQN